MRARGGPGRGAHNRIGMALRRAQRAACGGCTPRRDRRRSLSRAVATMARQLARPRVPGQQRKKIKTGTCSALLKRCGCTTPRAARVHLTTCGAPRLCLWGRLHAQARARAHTHTQRTSVIPRSHRRLHQRAARCAWARVGPLVHAPPVLTCGHGAVEGGSRGQRDRTQRSARDGRMCDGLLGPRGAQSAHAGPKGRARQRGPRTYASQLPRAHAHADSTHVGRIQSVEGQPHPGTRSSSSSSANAASCTHCAPATHNTSLLVAPAHPYPFRSSRVLYNGTGAA